MSAPEQVPNLRVIPGLTCACGCGEVVNAGKTWRTGHHLRVKNPNPRHAVPRPRTQHRRCPRCGQLAVPRKDGTLGKHWDSARKDRQRCVEGELNSGPPQAPGRRVKVTVDAVIPAGMTVGEFQLAAAAVLRVGIDDAFVVRTRVGGSS